MKIQMDNTKDIHEDDFDEEAARVQAERAEQALKATIAFNTDYIRKLESEKNDEYNIECYPKGKHIPLDKKQGFKIYGDDPRLISSFELLEKCLEGSKFKLLQIDGVKLKVTSYNKAKASFILLVYHDDLGDERTCLTKL